MSTSSEQHGTSGTAGSSSTTAGGEESRSFVDRTTELSEGLLEAVETGQRAALEAVQKFIDAVDQAMPLHGEGASRRQEVIDSAMEMTDKLVHTQYDFLRSIVRRAGETLSRSSPQ